MPDLEERLRADAEQWRTTVPTSGIDLSRLEHGPRRPRAWLVAAAVVLVAVGVPVAVVANRDEAAKAPAHSPRPVLAEPTLPPAQLARATELARAVQRTVRGTFVGAVAQVVGARSQDVPECGAGPLLRVRVVWEDDADFVHGGTPFGEPDGPLKAIVVYAPSSTGTVCAQGSSYRAVGATADEALLYGRRPQDPTGVFRSPSTGPGSAACRDLRGQGDTRGPSAYVAELNIMSGLPNPHWTLTVAEAHRLKDLLEDSTAGIQDSAQEMGGFIVRAADSQSGFLAGVGLGTYFWVPAGSSEVARFLATSSGCHPEVLPTGAQLD